MTSRFGFPAGLKIQTPFASWVNGPAMLGRVGRELLLPLPQPASTKRSAATTTGVKAVLT